MKFKNVFRRKVDKLKIKWILNDFIEHIKSEIIIHIVVTNRGVVKLYTNSPGTLIGKAGEDINMLTKRFKEECNAKDVKIYEMKYIASNCSIY